LIKENGFISDVLAMSKMKTTLFLLISLLIIQPVESQSLLDRMRVPIYVKPSVTIGYDNNILRFSSTEIGETVPNDPAMGDAETLGKNVGDDYISDEGQQAFYLSFRNLGATGLGTTYAQMDFTTINSGETIGFSSTFFWNANVEFPSEVILYIGYDEDIKTDGNLNNDDNNPENDIIIISGYDIHDLFH